MTKKLSKNCPWLVAALQTLWNYFSQWISGFISFVIDLLSLLLRFIDQLLGTIPSLVRAQNIISKKISERNSKEILTSDDRLKLPLDHLKSNFKIDLKRLEGIEEKARGTVIGVAISVSLSSTSILLLTRQDALASENTTIKILLAVLISLSVFFLLASGFLALSAYRVGAVFRPRIVEHIGIRDESELKKSFLSYIEMNRLLIIRKANFLSASMDCLRNGLFLILLFVVAALWFAVL